MTDVLYKKTSLAGQPVPVPDREEKEDDQDVSLQMEEDDEEVLDSDSDQEEEEMTVDEDLDERFILVEDINDEIVPDIKEDFKQLLNKTRKLIKYFRSYPSRRDVLQEAYDAVQKEMEQEQKGVTLTLDVCTRWNSIIAMLLSAITMKKAFQRAAKSKALQSQKEKPVLLTSKEWASVEDLHDALYPVELLTKALCGENVDLLSADAAFLVAVDTLARQKNKTSDSLLASLKSRYLERKNISVLSILYFCHSPKEYEDNKKISGLLEVEKLREEIEKQYSRLFSEDEELAEEDEKEDEMSPLTRDKEGSDRERTKLLFQQSVARVKKPIQASEKIIYNNIMEEVTAAFQTHEMSDKMTRLQKLHKAMLSVPGASIECERAFSCVSRFNTKLRNRLNDESLDRLTFAKYWMKNSPL